MHQEYPNSRGPAVKRRHAALALLALPLLLAGASPVSREASTASSSTVNAGGASLTAAATAVVNMTDLANAAKLGINTAPPVRVLLFPEMEEPAEPSAPASPNSIRSLGPAPTSIRPTLNVASPSPSQNYQGLDDIPMADSSFIVIPPDVAGAVGPTKVMESFNNNYRIRNKATGATISTVGTATFWAAVTLPSERLSLTDPRTTYDPYNNRWIACMQTVGLGGSILVGVSQTSDPSGAWFLYKFTGFPIPVGATGYQLDYPILGFNKNWVAVTINQFTQAGAFTSGICLTMNYPLLQTGTGTATLFTLNVGPSVPAGANVHFCASPAWTYSASEESLFVVTHISSGGASFTVDVITGTPAAPVYNAVLVVSVRPGGGWTQPSGNIQPQSVPNAGASACGATPCKIETSDSQVRQSPVYRNGFLWYAQTIGLPAGGLTRTAAQWTKLTPSLSPAFVDGGRLDDPTATSINGGKWYDHCSLSVNSSNDMILGFTQFSSAQHPSAGYAMRLGPDAPGTIRDAFIYHAGEDYYHKTFTTATGRNRWGDFTTCQVDPCDDQTLWTLQEYGKNRTGTDDGNTGSNSSKWSSWWAAVAGVGPVASLTCPGDQTGAPGGSIVVTFRVTNSGTGSGSFSYSVTDVTGWGGPVSGTTPALAPAGFFDVPVTFNIPSNCSPPQDVATFSAQPVGPTGCYTPVFCNTKIFCDVATAALVSRFDASPAARGVDLTWWSDAVGQVESWNVYRAPTEESGWTRVNSSPIPMSSAGQFRLNDPETNSGSMFYRLSAVLPGIGEQVLSSTKVSADGESFSFAISGGNPFTSKTTLRYALPRAERVKVDVYSVTGERVRTLVDRMESPGVHTVDFELRGGTRTLAPGIYLARITAGTERRTLRMVAME